MWFTVVASPPNLENTGDIVWYQATSMPPMRPKFVTTLYYVSSTNQYIVGVDPGWLSGLRKSGKEVIAALAKAGFADAMEA